MLWIEDGPDSILPAVATSNLFDSTMATHSSPSYEKVRNDDITPLPVLTLSETIHQTEGGLPGNGNMLGWSTGVLSIRQRWQKLSGVILMPPKTAELRAGTPYGRVGLNNRSQNLLLGTQLQEAGDLLPTAAQIAKSYTQPGGGNA